MICLIRTASTSHGSATEQFLLFLGELSGPDLALKLNVTLLLCLICQLDSFVASDFHSYTLLVTFEEKKKKLPQATCKKRYEFPLFFHCVFYFCNMVFLKSCRGAYRKNARKKSRARTLAKLEKKRQKNT